MSTLGVWVLFFVVSSFIPNQGNALLREHEISSRFGFTILDSFRKMFCRSFCNPIDDNPYILNLSCAIKCPELYLPNHTTKAPSTPALEASMSTLVAATSKLPSSESETPSADRSTSASSTEEQSKASSPSAEMMEKTSSTTGNKTSSTTTTAATSSSMSPGGS